MAWSQPVDRVPPPVATMRSGRQASPVELVADHETARFVGGAQHRGAAVREIEIVQARPPGRVVERDALSPWVRRPHRHANRVG